MHGQPLQGPTPASRWACRALPSFCSWLPALQKVELRLTALRLPRLQSLQRALTLIDRSGLDVEGFEKASLNATSFRLGGVSASEVPARWRSNRPAPIKCSLTVHLQLSSADWLAGAGSAQARGERTDLAALGQGLPPGRCRRSAPADTPERGGSDPDLTEVGRQFAEATVQEEKRLFRQQALSQSSRDSMGP